MLKDDEEHFDILSFTACSDKWYAIYKSEDGKEVAYPLAGWAVVRVYIKDIKGEKFPYFDYIVGALPEESGITLIDLWSDPTGFIRYEREE